MKILITGGAGFIGSNVVDAYIDEGHDVIIVDNLSTGKKENLNPRAKFYHADICDAGKMMEIFQSEKPEVVNHHAAQIDVRKSVEDPACDARINIIGIINLLECAQKSGVRKFIFASSGGTIYGECGDKAPDEKTQPNPLSPYGVSKLASEFYLRFYAETYDLKFTSLRYGNVYGPRQDPHGEAGVVAIFARRLLKNEEIFIYGDGEQMRDYVYVSDVAGANLLALNLADNEVVNIGTSIPLSVNELFAAMKKNVPEYKNKAVFKPPRKGELFKSFLDINKARRILNWKPEVALADGIRRTIKYFKDKINEVDNNYKDF